MRRFVIAAIIALVVPFALPATVGATGDCTVRVVLYENSDYSGLTRTFCYGVNDSNIETESPTNNMGPLSDGSYRNDFSASETQSGVMSARFYKASGTYRVCFYTGANQSGGATWLSTNGQGAVFLANQTPGSVYLNAIQWCA